MPISEPPIYAGQPPAAYAPPLGYGVYRPAGTGTSKPIGIILLAIVEAGIAVVDLFVALSLLYWTVYRLAYDEIGYGALDLVLAVAYIATSAVTIGLIVGIWRMRPWAWLAAHLLAIVLIGMIAFSVFWWGISLLDIIGVVVNVFVLISLNVNPIRRNFGQRPLLQ